MKFIYRCCLMLIVFATIIACSMDRAKTVATYLEEIELMTKAAKVNVAAGDLVAVHYQVRSIDLAVSNIKKELVPEYTMVTSTRDLPSLVKAIKPPVGWEAN